MELLSENEIELVSGGFDAADLGWGLGTTWAGYFGSTATTGSGIFASTAGSLGGALGASSFLAGAAFGTYVVNPALDWASTNVWGGSGSLGSDIYDWTH